MREEGAGRLDDEEGRAGTTPGPGGPLCSTWGQGWTDARGLGSPGSMQWLITHQVLLTPPPGRLQPPVTPGVPSWPLTRQCGPSPLSTPPQTPRMAGEMAEGSPTLEGRKGRQAAALFSEAPRPWWGWLNWTPCRPLRSQAACLLKAGLLGTEKPQWGFSTSGQGSYGH